MTASSPRLSAENFTVELIRERLRDSSPGPDPTAVNIGNGSRDWPTGLQRRLTTNLKPAGVLIPIVERASGLFVLLTRRSSELKHHAGQISFPGGRMEPQDVDIRDTALRETHEEIGIEPTCVDVAGYLTPMPTITGYAVTPVVGLLGGGIRLTLDPSEVDVAFEVPLPFLLDPGNERRGERVIDEIPVPIVEFTYGGHRIWGATASMIVALRNNLVI